MIISNPKQIRLYINFKQPLVQIANHHIINHNFPHIPLNLWWLFTGVIRLFEYHDGPAATSGTLNRSSLWHTITSMNPHSDSQSLFGGLVRLVRLVLIPECPPTNKGWSKIRSCNMRKLFFGGGRGKGIKELGRAKQFGFHQLSCALCQKN